MGVGSWTRFLIMKNILILAYDFPPYKSVGAQRPFSWANDLNNQGYKPIIVTRQWRESTEGNIDYISNSESSEVVFENKGIYTQYSTPYQSNLSNRLLLKYGSNRFVLFRKVLSGILEILQFFLNVGPKKEIYKCANDLLKTGLKVDAILATGEPFVLFHFASKLSLKYNIPWIADYRDPWSQNVVRQKNKLFFLFIKKMEIKVLKNVSGVTTVSELFKKKILELNDQLDIKVIPNGFDISNLISVFNNFEEDVNSLNIGFGGSIYQWHPLKIVIKVINEVVESGNCRITLNFYGVSKEQFDREIKGLNLVSGFTINFNSRVSNQLLIKKLRENSILLLFNDYSIIGTKIYDYLAVSRKVFLCFTNDAESKILKDEFFHFEDDNISLQQELLEKTGAGIAMENREVLKIELKVAWTELQTTKKVGYTNSDISIYSRQHSNKLLGDFIEKSIRPV
jgi:hypothetical protein